MDAKDLITGTTYYDIKNKQEIEFRYIGGTGLAIVCDPGDSGGGMQSCWGIPVTNLQKINEDEGDSISFERHRESTVKDCELVISILNNIAAKVKLGNMHAFEDFWAIEEDEGQTILSIREKIILGYLARQERIKN